ENGLPALRTAASAARDHGVGGKSSRTGRRLRSSGRGLSSFERAIWDVAVEIKKTQMWATPKLFDLFDLRGVGRWHVDETRFGKRLFGAATNARSRSKNGS